MNPQNKQRPEMDSPITYYGGKKTLAPTLLSLIPTHTTYVEPFLGGGALFFAKPQSQVEVINDLNREVVNFYQVAKTNFDALQEHVQSTPHSRALSRDAFVMYENPHLFNEVERAWAFYTLCNQGYAGKISQSWGYGTIDNKRENALARKRENFVTELRDRLETTQIECYDAVRLIELRDRPDTFFYCDPPYVGSNMGHYAGYTQRDFEALLDALSKIKGKFLLSSYPNDVLDAYVKANGWNQIKMDMPCYASAKRKRKTEVLTANYALS